MNRSLFPTDADDSGVSSGDYDRDDMATVVNPAFGAAADCGRVKEQLVAWGLLKASAWDLAYKSIPRPRTVPAVLRQLGKTPLEATTELRTPMILSDFQIRQILAGFGERLRMGDCVLIRQAGASAYGENFQGRKLKPPRLVLVQTFTPPAGCDRDQFADTVVRYARELTTLHHPMLPAILEIGQAHGFAFVAIERQPSFSLWSFVKRTIRKRRTIGLSRILQIGSKVAEVLNHLHTRKWCHGEICPDTILLGKSGEVWLQSAGLLDLAFECFAAHCPGDQVPEYRQWWTWSGSYGAPEVRDGQIKPTAAADVYSLAAVLFFLLTGKPFSPERLHESAPEHWDLTDREDASPQLQQKVFQLISAALNKRTNNRPSAAEVHNILNRCVVELSIPDTQVGPSEPVPPTGQFSQVKSAPASECPTLDSSPPNPATSVASGQGTMPEIDPNLLKRESSTQRLSIADIVNYFERTILEPFTKRKTEQITALSHTVLEVVPQQTQPIAPSSSSTTSIDSKKPQGPASDSEVELSALEAFEDGCQFLSAGEPETALQYFELAVLKDDGFWQAWYNRGLALRRLWRMSEAADDFRRATTFAPKEPRAWFQLGVALACSGEFEEAVDAFELAKWLGHPRAAEAIARCREQLANIRQANDANRAEAIRLAARARAEAHAKRWDQALARYVQALQHDPQNHRIWYDMGVVCSSLNRLEEAIDAFSRSVAFCPDYRRAWYNRGVGLVKLGNLGQALECFERAEKLGHPMANVAAQQCRQRLANRTATPSQSDGPPPSSLDEDIQGDAPEAYYLRRGNALVSERLFREAIDIFERALAHNPYYWEAWYAKGRAALGLANRKLAEHCFRRVLKLNKSCASAWYEVGKLLVDRGQDSEAYDYFRKAHRYGHPSAERALRNLQQAQSLSGST